MCVDAKCDDGFVCVKAIKSKPAAEGLAMPKLLRHTRKDIDRTKSPVGNNNNKAIVLRLIKWPLSLCSLR